ncbi:hypothetical protein ACS0TY_002995 [Phlomoides rotata]
MWWGNACRSKKMLMRSESRMDIQEILKMKLETINEEPDENRALVKHHSSISNKVRKIHFKIKITNLFTSQFRNKLLYALLHGWIRFEGRPKWTPPIVY